MTSMARRGVLCALALTAGVTLTPSAATAAAKPKTQPVNIGFTAVAGKTPVACGTPIGGLGTTNQAAQLLDLRFYVSDVRLVRRNGSTVPVRLRASPGFQVTRDGHGVTLIDLENGRGACADGTAATNGSVRGTVPRGSYVGVRWTLGVPFALNHSNAVTAPAPLNSSAMAWSWQFGRKFAKIEFADPGGATGTWTEHGFLVHLGSTGCVGNPATGQAVRCKAANRGEIRLARFNPKLQKVAVDIKELVAGNDITKNGGDAPGCMSGPTDPECPGVFKALGMSFTPQSGGGGHTGGGHGPARQHAGSAVPRQRVFRAVFR